MPQIWILRLPDCPLLRLSCCCAAAAVLHMCKSKRSLQAVEPQGSKSRSNSSSAAPTKTNSSSTMAAVAALSFQTAETTSASSLSPSTYLKLVTTDHSGSSSSTSISASSLAEVNRVLSDPHRPVLFPSRDLSTAAASPSATRLSGSSHRCRLPCGGRDAVVSRLHFHGDASSLPQRLSRVSRRHHASLARLLGASLAAPNCVLLAYEYVPGATLAHCLDPPRDAAGGFTLLPSWLSRVQVAADVASGLEYIHSHGGGREEEGESLPVHNRIKSTAIVVTEPDLRARICHSATAELTGEIDRGRDGRGVRISGTRGYMAPEIIAGGAPTQKSDVYAYGVVLLELLTGEEPVAYRRGTDGSVECTSLVEVARDVVRWSGSGKRGEETDDEREERRHRVRRWVDSRLKDSFPVDVAETMARLAVSCVAPEAHSRPEMVAVAAKVSRLLLRSKEWASRMKVQAGFTASLAPR